MLWNSSDFSTKMCWEAYLAKNTVYLQVAHIFALFQLHIPGWSQMKVIWWRFRKKEWTNVSRMNMYQEKYERNGIGNGNFKTVFAYQLQIVFNSALWLSSIWHQSGICSSNRLEIRSIQRWTVDLMYFAKVDFMVH